MKIGENSAEMPRALIYHKNSQFKYGCDIPCAFLYRRISVAPLRDLAAYPPIPSICVWRSVYRSRNPLLWRSITIGRPRKNYGGPDYEIPTRRIPTARYRQNSPSTKRNRPAKSDWRITGLNRRSPSQTTGGKVETIRIIKISKSRTLTMELNHINISTLVGPRPGEIRNITREVKYRNTTQSGGQSTSRISK